MALLFVLLAALREVHGVERLAAGRVWLVTFDVLLEAQGRLGVGDGRPRGFFVDDLLRLHVGVPALVLVNGRSALLQQLVHPIVFVVRDVLGVRLRRRGAGEQHVQEVVRVAVVPGPTEQRHVVGTAAGLFEVGTPTPGSPA